MPGIQYDVVGIGNALVDVIAHADDGFIGEHELVKGSMTLVDTDRALYLYQALGGAIEMSGGSAANTMCGVASFGGTAAYIGKVSDDELGRVFGHDCRAVGVQFRPGAPADGTPTGRCIIVVTPDAQRTMNTYLGVSSLLAPSDIDADTVAVGEVLYMEGYLYDRPEAKEAFRYAATDRPRQRSSGVADTQRLVLRRSSPRRLSGAGDRRGRPAVRQRGRADVAVRGRVDGRSGQCGSSATVRWPWSRSAPRAAWS